MVGEPRSSTRGKSQLGCLLSIALIIALIYYGSSLGKVWWRYYEIQDRMRGAGHFAATQNDATLLKRLAADVDDVGLPAEAKQFRITRLENPPQITIWTEYHEVLQAPFVHKVVTFQPRVTVRP